MTYANVPELPPPRRPTQPLESPVPEHTETVVPFDKFLDGHMENVDIDEIPDDAQEHITYRSGGKLEPVTPESASNMMKIFDAEYAVAAAHKQHLWIATMAYKIEPPLRDGMIFDATMLRMAHFGCYICEEPYRAKEVGQPCPGEPQPTGRHSA